jgi:5S rRNA maturation endonuclease (ribonuclease M5)
VHYNQELLEKLEMLLEELRELNIISQIPIIVEGEKDAEALRALGCTGTILCVNVGIPVFNFCERLSRDYARVIVLTDWDYHGGKLCRLIIDGLEANGVKYDASIRARLSKYCKREIKDIESLSGYMASLRKSVTNISRTACT